MVRKKKKNFIDKTLLQKLEAIFSGFERKVFFQKGLKGNIIKRFFTFQSLFGLDEIKFS